MNGTYVVLIVAGVLLLIGCIRIGGQVEYCEQGLFVRLRLGPVLIPVFPVKKKDGQKRVKQKKPAKSAPPAKPKKGGQLQLALKFIPLVLDTVKRFFRKLRVDELDVELVISAADPADAAMAYGRANALLGALWQPMTEVFHVEDGHAHVGVDFEGETQTLYLLASLSLTAAQTLGLALVFAVRALGIFIRTRSVKQKQNQQGEAV